MKLLVDLGNTRIKWALIEEVQGSSVNFGARSVFSYKGSASNEVMLSSQGLPNELDEVIISSVASADLLARHCYDLTTTWDCAPTLVKVKSQHGSLKNAYDNIDALGVDRWVAAIGAHTHNPNESLIVIDAGTAITIDVLSERNEFLGGVIMPGVGLMRGALNGKTAQIHAHAKRNSPLIGRTTDECVNSGVRLSISGGVDRALELFAKQLNKSMPRVLICGGDAKWLVSASQFDLEYNPDMLFDGLETFSQR